MERTCLEGDTLPVLNEYPLPHKGALGNPAHDFLVTRYDEDLRQITLSLNRVGFCPAFKTVWALSVRRPGLRDSSVCKDHQESEHWSQMFHDCESRPDRGTLAS